MEVDELAPVKQGTSHNGRDAMGEYVDVDGVKTWFDSWGSGPALVLLQEIFGVNRYLREVADRYAEEGYVTIAPDLFWRFGGSNPEAGGSHRRSLQKRSSIHFVVFGLPRSMYAWAATCW